MYVRNRGGSFRCILCATGVGWGGWGGVGGGGLKIRKNAYVINGRPCITGNLNTIFPIVIQILCSRINTVGCLSHYSARMIPLVLTLELMFSGKISLCAVLWNQCHAETLCLFVI